MSKIDDFLRENEEKELLRFTTAGSVDDGKSTLIGRLLHDSKGIYEDQLASIKKATKNQNIEIDFALLTDGLKAEREQGITIDVAYRYFSTPKRKFIIADTPGHEQYTRNMATGASTADLAIILIDAVNGLLPQSKRHAFISTLFQIPHMIVAVNKMDLVNWDEAVFRRFVEEFSAFSEKLELHDLRFIPISALCGDNVVEAGSQNMPWYTGPSLLNVLESVHIRSDQNLIDFRFPVQLVSRPDRTFRGFSGQIASGVLKTGSEILALPSMQTSKVERIVTWDGDLKEARPGQSITVTLEDEIDVSRGDMLVHPENRPNLLRRFEAMVVWMDENPLDPNERFILKTQAKSTQARVDTLRYRVDVNTLHKEPVETLQLNEIGRLVLTSNQVLSLDAYKKNRHNGQFILISRKTNRTIAAGMVIFRENPDQLPTNMAVSAEEILSSRQAPVLLETGRREQKNGHKALTVWFTGLLSSGKTECALALENELFERGIQAKVLSGGAIRKGMSRDLGFSSEDTTEHLRRVAETAKILNDSGILVLASFISPVQITRRAIANIVGPDRFLEVYFDASAAWCADQDETGLYQQAASNPDIQLPGVTFPYEAPQNPDYKAEVEATSPGKVREQLLSWILDQAKLD